jgi:DNA-binding transcriptional LysR family regulator
LIPTEAGGALLAEAERMELIALSAVGAARGHDLQVRGHVTLTVGDALGTRFLAPRLAPLLQAHPALEVELLVEARVLDLSRGEADVALRMAPADAEPLVSRKVGAVATGLYASVDYLERQAPQTRGPSSELRFISRGSRGRTLPEEQWLRQQWPGPISQSFTSYSTAGQLAAASAGLGIAALPCFWADTVPELRRLWPERVLVRDLWVVTRRDARKTGRIRTLIDFIVALFARHSALLLGNLGAVPLSR